MRLKQHTNDSEIVTRMEDRPDLTGDKGGGRETGKSHSLSDSSGDESPNNMMLQRSSLG